MNNHRMRKRCYQLYDFSVMCILSAFSWKKTVFRKKYSGLTRVRSIQSIEKLRKDLEVVGLNEM